MGFQVFPAHPPRLSYGWNWAAFVAAGAGDAETYGTAGGRCKPRILIPDRKWQDHGSAGNRHAPMMTPDDAA